MSDQTTTRFVACKGRVMIEGHPDALSAFSVVATLNELTAQLTATQAKLAEAQKETLAAKARMNMMEDELMLRDARNET